MKVEMRELSRNDGRDIFEMLQEIGPGENGFINSEHDIDYSEFPHYLRSQVNMSKGIGINLNRYVPQTKYWLFIDGRPVGIGKLRHCLNEFLVLRGGHIGYTIRPSERGKGYGNIILRELLKKALEKEIDEVLLTCKEDNIPSRKVIEYNGGDLQDVIEEVRRYWIKTSPFHEKEPAIDK